MRCINEQCQKEIGEVSFCPYCGTKQEKPKVYCIYCGAEMDEDGIFCNNCGKKSFFVQQREREEEARLAAEAEAQAERDRLAQLAEQERLSKEKAANEQKRKEQEEKERAAQKEKEKKAAAERLRREAEKKQAQAQEDYGDLMADLIPDLISNAEKLEVHLFFVKKLARDSGWDEDETVSALMDLLSMYSDFKQSRGNGSSFSSGEKKLLLYQAGIAHIDETVLSKLF